MKYPFLHNTIPALVILLLDLLGKWKTVATCVTILFEPSTFWTFFVVYIYTYIYPLLLARLQSLLQVGLLTMMTLTRVIVMDWMLSVPIFCPQLI